MSILGMEDYHLHCIGEMELRIVELKALGMDGMTAAHTALRETKEYQASKRLKQRIREILGLELDRGWWTVAVLEGFGTDEAKAAVAQARKELEGEQPEPTISKAPAELSSKPSERGGPSAPGWRSTVNHGTRNYNVPARRSRRS
jgi:hypothetical protein